jgi:hypothetical protein
MAYGPAGGIESRPELRRIPLDRSSKWLSRAHALIIGPTRPPSPDREALYPTQRAPILRNPAKNVTVRIALFISLSLAPFGVAVSQQLASLRTGESIRLTAVSRPRVIFGDTVGDTSRRSNTVCTSNTSGLGVLMTCLIGPFRLKGKFLAVSPDTITLRESNRAQSVALSDIRLLEVKRRNAGTVTRSIVLGLLAGGAAGALIGSTRGPTNTGDGIITTPEKEVIGGILGGLAGVIGGTVYGVCCSGGWERVPIPRNP